MPNRDWKKDWEMCEKATPGPWKYGKDESEWFVAQKIGDNLIACLDYYYSTEEKDKTNFVFIAETREALPYWLQRVRELEARLRRLEEALRGAEIYVHGKGPVTLDDLLAETEKELRQP